MGVTADFPDLMFIGPRGQVCWIELKASRGRLSEAQGDVASHLVTAGHGYLCSNDYRDVIETLKGWGALRSIVSMQ
jgi:hypothetical protein